MFVQIAPWGPFWGGGIRTGICLGRQAKGLSDHCRKSTFMIPKTYSFKREIIPKRSQHVRIFLCHVVQLKYIAKKCLIYVCNPEFKHLALLPIVKG